MEVVINYNDTSYHFDIDDKTTGRDVRRLFQKKCAVVNGEYRLLCESTAEILHDEDIIADHPGTEDVEFPDTASSKLSKSEESDKEEDEVKVKSDSSGSDETKEKVQEGGDQAVPVEVEAVKLKLEAAIEDEGGDEEKKIDLLLAEKNMNRKVELLMSLYSRCEAQKQVDFDFIRNEVVHVLRLQKVPGTMQVPPDGGRIPRIKRLVLVVQEGFPVFLQARLDGYWVTPCLGHDSLKYLRERFAKLLNIENPQHLVLRMLDEKEELGLDSDERTLDDLKIEAKTVLVATRVGEQVLKVVFNFSISVDMRMDYGKSVSHNAKQLVLRHAPDLHNVRFDFWYRGHTINMEYCGNRLLGQEILGLHFLRVMLVFDPELGYEVDPSPQIRMFRVPRVMPTAENFHEIFKEMEQSASNNAYKRALEAVAKMRRNRVGVERRSPSPEPPKNPNDRILRLIINKRAKRYLSILVEREPEGEDQAGDSLAQPAVHTQPPFTIEGVTLSMTVAELKQKLYQETQEPPEYQTITIKGRLLTPEDDYRSLRSLELGNFRSIYMEPTIKVKVKVENSELELQFPCRKTTFRTIQEEIEKQFHIPIHQCYLEYKGVAAIPSFYLSDYRIANNDEIRFVKPFKLDIWNDVVLYQQSVWAHTSPLDVWRNVSNESGIDLEDLVICTPDLKTHLPQKKPTLEKCGIRDDMEFDLFRKAEYNEKVERQRKEQKADVAPPAAAGQYLTSSASMRSNDPRRIFGDRYIESNTQDDDDDDDPDYEEGRSLGARAAPQPAAQAQAIDEDSDDDDNYSDDDQ